MADSLVHKESVMSQCWPRSRSPAGFNEIFFKPRALTSPSLRTLGGFLCCSSLSCISYIATFTIHIPSCSPTICDRGGRTRGKAELSTSTTSSISTEYQATFNMDIDKLFKVHLTFAYVEEMLNRIYRLQSSRLVAANVGCPTRPPPT